MIGQSLLARRSCWEMLEKPSHTLQRKLSVFRHAADVLSQGFLLLRDASLFPVPPFQLCPGSALIVFGGDFQLRLKTAASGICTLLERSRWSLRPPPLAPVASSRCSEGFTRQQPCLMGHSILSPVARALGDGVAG